MIAALLFGLAPALLPRPADAGLLGGTMWLMDTGGKIHQYNLATNGQTALYTATTEIGRGLAYDPSDGKLWYSALLNKGFSGETDYYGDGNIHKIDLATGAQSTIPDPTVGQMTTYLQGIGALSIDPYDGSLWAASDHVDANNNFWFYNLNDLTGAVISKCSTPKVSQIYNHNLKVTKPGDLGGKKVLLSELALSASTIYTFNTDCTPVLNANGTSHTYTLPVSGGFTGMDVDNLTGHLIGTDETYFYDVGTAPYGTSLGNFGTGAVGEGLTLKQDNVVPAISGRAYPCGEVPTPVVTAQILSGSIVVATVPLNADGSWSLTGAAPNATYAVAYLSSSGVAVCGGTITTDGNGNGTTATPQSTPYDKGNHSWANCDPNAASIPSWVNSAFVPSCHLDGKGSTVIDYLRATNKSDWYSVDVGPGEQVSIALQTPSIPVAVYLYRDLHHEVDLMSATSAAPDLHALSASLGAAQSAPFDQGPFDQGPFDQGPFDQGPFDQGPFDQGPFDQGPFDQGSVDPAPFDQGPFDQGAYTSAQHRALIAYSARRGASPLLVIRNTWDRSGTWYFRFVGVNGAFDLVHPITFSATVKDNGCGALNMTPLAPSTTSVTAAKTLFLTDTAQFSAADGSTSSLTTRLSLFQTAHPELGIQIVDLKNDANISLNYGSWTAHPSCAAAANIVATSIQQLISKYRQSGSLQYVVLVGGDHVIPYWRVPDESALGHERSFSPPVADLSTSQAQLRQDYFMTQDFYGSASSISRPSHDMYLPSTVSVGRLVENVTQISAMLNAYDAIGGVLHTYDTSGGAVNEHRALVTGYSGLARLASNVQSTLGTTGGMTVDSLIEDPTKGPSDPSAWTADQLRKAMLADPATGAPAPRHDILALQGHFSAIGALAADYKTAIYSSELKGASNPSFQNTLVLTNGCHSVYNVANSDAINASVALDWAEVFAGQGMTSIGGTGYQYFDSDLLLLTSGILDNLTRQLTYDPNPSGTHTPVPIGAALNAAKLNYVDGLVGMEGTAEKSIGVLTLNGLPFWSVDLYNRQPASGLVSWFNLNPTGSGGVTAIQRRTAFATYDVKPSYMLSEQDLVRQVIDSGGNIIGTNVDSYFSVDGTAGVWASPYRPVLPQQTMNVHASNLSGYVARGNVLLSADYTDQTANQLRATPFRPYVEVPSTEFGGLHPHFNSSVFAPLQTSYLNDLIGESLHVLPMQYRSTSSGGTLLETGTARLLSKPSYRVYYSSSTDPSVVFAGPPTIAQVRVTPSSTAGSVHVDVIVSGPLAVDLEDLLVSYTATGWPHLNSCSLITSGLDTSTVSPCGNPVRTNLYQPSGSNGYLRMYSSDFASPTGKAVDVQLFIQAISGTGVATQDTNAGLYYNVDSTSLASPKAATQVKLGALPASVAYHSLVPVSAKLSAGGNPVAGKLVTFTLGQTRVVAMTDGTGTATPKNGLPANVAPGGYVVQAGFVEDLSYLASGDQGTLAVSAASTSFRGSGPVTVQYSHQAVVARLVSGSNQLDGRSVVIDIGSNRKIGTLTDMLGQVILDTRIFDGQPIAPGAYTVNISYNNPGGAPYDDRFTSATTAVAVNVSTENASIHFNNPGPLPAGLVTLSGVVSQPADTSLGDITLARVTYTLTPSNGAAAIKVNNVAVRADGTSDITVTLPAGLYTVSAIVGPRNGVQWFSGGLDATSSTLLPVYDPARAVTGAGKVALNVSPDIGVPTSGFAKFAFAGAYLQGAVSPSGAFGIQTADQTGYVSLSISMSGFDWLVITGGNRAELQGTGAIVQGTTSKSNQKFRLVVTVNPDGSSQFELHVWDPAASSGNSYASPEILVKGTIPAGSAIYAFK
jgi:hypothetical protein